MQVEDLLRAVPSGQLYGPEIKGEITQLVNDTRNLVPGCAFVAIKGLQFDGHTAVDQVAAAGAKLMVVEVLPENWQDYPLSFFLVPSTFRAQALLANQFFGRPTEQLNVVAVTGTNGKTTISSLISDLLMRLGHKTGLIGTLHYKVDQTYYPSINTTPNALALQQLFAEMVSVGCQDALIEASSHALALGRLWATDIDCAIFTNLTREHLDFHKTMESYAYAKSLLFAQLGQKFAGEGPRLAIINADDPYASIMMQATSADVLTYSLQDSKASAYADQLAVQDGNQTFRLHYRNQTYQVVSPMLGAYNVANFMAAFLCLVDYYHVQPQIVVDLMLSFGGVEGRMQRLDLGQEFQVVVDFAHTPDAIERVLQELKAQSPKRLVTIIGHSGGNRDSGARPEIGDKVFEHSDWIIFTADNPRHEPVAKICAELIGNHDEVPYEVIEDRKAAIDYVISQAQAGDLLVFAGKGSEPYQIIGDDKLPYDEVTEIEAAVARHFG